MKIITLILILYTLQVLNSYGQSEPEPQILILAPNQIIYDKIFEKELSEINTELKERFKEKFNEAEIENFLNSEEFTNKPERIKSIIKNEIEFYKNIDFFVNESLTAKNYLVYRFYENFPKQLIFLRYEKSSDDLRDLKKYSEMDSVQYVLNFSSIELYKENGMSYAKITVQLYDKISNSLKLNNSFIGDWNNPGLYFACQDSTLHCTVNNAMSQILEEVASIIFRDSPKIIKEKKLGQQRYEILMTDYYMKPFDTLSIRKIIPVSDESIKMKFAYQTLFSNDSTKFVAFFLEEVSKQDFKTLNENKTDKVVNIITEKNMTDEDYLDDIPQNYAYMVRGVYYKNKWYYEKLNVTYLRAGSLNETRLQYFNNLQKSNFFKENSVDLNPEFWETNLFKKIPKPIEEAEKKAFIEQYGFYPRENEEIYNKNYVGLYEVVANNLRDFNTSENKRLDSIISASVFIPAYENQIQNNYDKFSKYSMLFDKLTLIYPMNREVVLNPVVITDKEGNNSLRYFVNFKNGNGIYEWVYFKTMTNTQKNWYYALDIQEQLNTLTKWTSEYETLEDKKFWEKYVTAQENGNYIYLKKVE